jgi:hypothetical protein
MAPAEVMKTLEQEQNPSLKEMGDKAEKFSDKDKVKLGETIKDRVETFTSMELLKDFSTRPQMKKLENTKNETYTSINEAIKDPTNKEKIIATQKTLGYSPEGKIYYNPSRDDIKDG